MIRLASRTLRDSCPGATRYEGNGAGGGTGRATSRAPGSLEVARRPGGGKQEGRLPFRGGAIGWSGGTLRTGGTCRPGIGGRGRAGALIGRGGGLLL